MDKPTPYAFIFDLDGVLVSTSNQHFRAWKQIARDIGFIMDEAFNEQLKGVSRKESLELILHAAHMDVSASQKEIWIDQKNKLYLDLISGLDERALLPGVGHFLDQCKELNLPMAIASASQNARMILEKTKILGYFKIIVDGNSVVHSKPHPEVFIKAAHGLELSSDCCIVFEDSIKGLIAAHAAGMFAVGVGKEEHLHEADMVIEGFDQTQPSDIYNRYKNIL